MEELFLLCGVQTDVIKGAPADPSALVASQLGLELYELGKEVQSTSADSVSYSLLHVSTPSSPSHCHSHMHQHR